MLCKACGYEHKGKWEYDGYKNIIGDEKFIDILTEHKFKIENPVECEYGDYDYQDYVNIGLQACPKCHTVILNVEDYI